METPRPGPPAVTAFVLGELRRLRDEADRIGRMAFERREAALCEALEWFRHHLAAQVLVERRLLVARLRGGRWYDHIVRDVSAAPGERLASVPLWRVEELFECAGGPTDTWPGAWLG